MTKQQFPGQKANGRSAVFAPEKVDLGDTEFINAKRPHFIRAARGAEFESH